MEPIFSLGQWIKRRRKARDLTQDALAQLVGCSLETIRKIEADARRPSRQIAERLADHLGLTPDERGTFLQTARAELSVERLGPPGHTTPQRPLTSPTTTMRRTNLPAQPTSLIGREREVVQVATLLRRADVRLVTLTGPGGTGKTRLALQVAAELLDDNADGVYLVNLAPVRDPANVVATIAQTLGVQESGNQPIPDILKAYLRDKQLLLVLDNFEQVLDAALLVSELLAAAPALRVLVTSRAVLRLQGEHEFAVPPLALPDLAHLPPLAQLTQYAAVALFIARAQAAQANFAVTNATAPAVAEICARVDGLPLALELAAARVKLFPPEALLARLEHRLQLLTSGPRDAPARQQTLRNAIEWSYDLLNAGEQRLFRRLGVFVGGCTLEAAEAVCNTAGDLPFAMVDGVAALVDQSLLRQELGTNGEPRLVMLETIREYARERLAEEGELEATQRHHADYFLELATEGEPVGSEEERDAAWYARRTADIGNLRAVLAWSHAAPDGAEIELRLVGALFWLWLHTDAVNEADVWITHALERSASASTFAQAKLVRAAGWVAPMKGAYAQASTLLEQELVLWRQLGHRANIAFCLVQNGRMARNQGHLTRARPFVEEALSMVQADGASGQIANALLVLGDIAFDQGDNAEATRLCTQARAIAQQHGRQSAGACALLVLARVAYAERDYGRAMALYEQSQAEFEIIQDSMSFVALHGQGKVALAQDDYMRAMVSFREAITDSKEYTPVTFLALEGLAAVAAAQGEGEHAAKLWGATETLRIASDANREAYEMPDYERWVAAARARFDAASFAAAWEAGRALSLEAAVAEALMDPDERPEG